MSMTPMAPMMGTPGGVFGGAAMASSPTPSATSAKPTERDDLVVVPLLAVPMANGGSTGVTSGAVAVPAGLQGRTSGTESTTGAVAGVIRPGEQRAKRSASDEDEPLDADVFQIPQAGTGIVITRAQQV
jgi:hypothetical protein